MYACASNSAMDVYDLQNPIDPQLIFSYNDVGHVHDAFVRNDSAFLNCGNQGLRILDFSTVNQLGDQPLFLGSLTSYPDAGYNHSGWLSNNGNIYVMQDENHGYDVKILDVSDVSNITVISTFNSGVDPQSMAHNGIIKDNYVYIPYYHDGIRIFDISNPNNPIQEFMYDTYLPLDHNSYKGAWGVYPFLPSGNIIVSDMQTGLYIFRVNGNINTISEQNQLIYLYPNPSQQKITITGQANKLYIYNMFGQRVLDRFINQNTKNTIDIGNLADGLYFYELMLNNDCIKQGKLILKK